MWGRLERKSFGGFCEQLIVPIFTFLFLFLFQKRSSYLPLEFLVAILASWLFSLSLYQRVYVCDGRAGGRIFKITSFLFF